MVIIKRGKGWFGGLALKFATASRDVNRPWSLVGSSCGFNANCQRSKESTDDSPCRRITGVAQASSVKYGGPGPIIPLGPR